MIFFKGGNEYEISYKKLDFNRSCAVFTELFLEVFEA